MRILHYFLGFPPYRSGGLTKYAFDLMKAQVSNGHIIMALWPGQMGVFNHKISIKRKKDISGIENYELINPLPVSLDEGINEFDPFMKRGDYAIYESFFRANHVEVIHIHTLMGIHKEFVEAAKNLGIRTVFTTHDYFGICPKVTLYRYGNACEDDDKCRNCIQCNCAALSTNKIIIMQSSLYRFFKNSAIVNQLRKKHRDYFFSNEVIPEMSITNNEILKMADQYQGLRAYYVGILEMVDLIHFNSSVTMEVYKKYLTPQNSVVMTITHQNISDNRQVNEWIPGDKLRILYLAPAKPFKGFHVLKSALDELWKCGYHNFELKLFSPVQNPSPYMEIHEQGFQYYQLKSIMADADVLVAPSIWHETFGYTVLEAISYGVPVIVSDHVGAKDVIGGGGIVVEAGNTEQLKDAIKSFDKNKQVFLRQQILTSVVIKRWNEYINDTYNLYIR